MPVNIRTNMRRHAQGGLKAILCEESSTVKLFGEGRGGGWKGVPTVRVWVAKEIGALGTPTTRLEGLLKRVRACIKSE